jgi:hypothetical protein
VAVAGRLCGSGWVYGSQWSKNGQNPMGIGRVTHGFAKVWLWQFVAVWQCGCVTVAVWQCGCGCGCVDAGGSGQIMSSIGWELAELHMGLRKCGCGSDGSGSLWQCGSVTVAVAAWLWTQRVAALPVVAVWQWQYPAVAGWHFATAPWQWLGGSG